LCTLGRRQERRIGLEQIRYGGGIYRAGVPLGPLRAGIALRSFDGVHKVRVGLQLLDQLVGVRVECTDAAWPHFTRGQREDQQQTDCVAKTFSTD
jgi:hypothetical protein